MSEYDATAGGLRLRLLPHEATPLYLQIVHQLKQLIITHRLDDGARLPAVRPLAESLGINPGTVVQAYRELAAEGLVESVRGRGTVVRRLSASTADERARAALLENAALAMATRARALGFGADEARQQLAAALLAAPPIPVVFVGILHAQAERYVAEQLNPRYADRGLRFVPFGVDAVVKGSPELLAELDVAYTVVTFVTTAPEVERHLGRLDVDVEILGVTAELNAGSVARLRALDAGDRPLVVTEHRSITNARAVVAEESGLDPDLIDVLATAPDDSLDEAALVAAAAAGRTIVYSFGVRPWVEALGIDPARLLEMRFELTADTHARLDARWGAR